jgi:Protein of unknown function (DUF2721)
MESMYKFMQDVGFTWNVLTAMITPAVLISACGTLVFSTSQRLARIVDRVRDLIRIIDELSTNPSIAFAEERRTEIERQLAIHARRSQYVQRSLTSLYISLGFFVAATVTIGIGSLVRQIMWVPHLLGITGTLVLFYGCLWLIAETRLALRAVNSEMEFILMLDSKYRKRYPTAETELKKEAKSH